MKAYKCDICGKLFENITDLSIDNGRFKDESIKIAVNYPYKNAIFPLEICPECIKKIQEVIDERKTYEKNQN